MLQLFFIWVNVADGNFSLAKSDDVSFLQLSNSVSSSAASEGGI